MAQQEVQAKGECRMLSVQLPPQKEDISETESKDVVMLDQNPAEVQSQDQALNGTDEVQVINIDEFDNPCDGESANAFRAASELPGEIAVEQKPDIESVKVKIDILEDQLKAAHRDQQSSTRELEKTRTQLANINQAWLKSKDCVKGQNKTIKKLRVDLKESKGNVRAEKSINSDLQDKLATSQEELTSCRDDLYSLQPKVPVAESQIVEELEIVGEEVVHWIETEVTSYEKAHPRAEEDHIFSVGDNEVATMFLAHHVGAGEHLVRYLVHRFLQANLFGRRYELLGLTEETARLLQKAEHSMANSDPPRGSVSIAAWRSETLQALAATEECQNIRKKQLQKMTNQLFGELGCTFPMFFIRRNSMERFYKQVLGPAANVAMMIQTSASTYKYSMAEHPFRNLEPLRLDHMKTHRMLDIKNGSYLKANARVVADKQGTIGKLIIPLEPGLYRTKDGKDGKMLRPVTVLVELNHPVAKSSQASA